MTLRKIDDEDYGFRAVKDTCRHPEHNPPTMIVLPNGLYEHTCPDCGDITVFRVQGPTWLGSTCQHMGMTS